MTNTRESLVTELFIRRELRSNVAALPRIDLTNGTAVCAECITRERQENAPAGKKANALDGESP